MAKAQARTTKQSLVTNSLRLFNIDLNISDADAQVDSNPLSGAKPRNWSNPSSGFFNGFYEAETRVAVSPPGMVHPVFDVVEDDDLDLITAKLSEFGIDRFSEYVDGRTTFDDLRESEVAQVVIDVVDQFSWQNIVEDAIAEAEADKRDAEVVESADPAEAVERELAGIDAVLDDGTLIQVKDTDDPTWDEEKAYNVLIEVIGFDGAEIEYEIVAER